VIYLNSNTANQTVRLSLNEGRDYFSTAFTEYLMVIEIEVTGQRFYLIPVIAAENNRITRLTIGLNVDNAVNGSIQITEVGRFNYEIYGQNSTTNLDPDDADVVGLVERGQGVLTGSTDYFDEVATTVPEWQEV
jgi:hypothetical protein